MIDDYLRYELCTSNLFNLGYSRQKSVPDVRLKSDGVTAKEGRPKSSAESLVSGLAKVATYG